MSVITLTFNSDPVHLNYVEFKYFIQNNPIFNSSVRERWQTPPRASAQSIQLDTPTAIPGERAAIQFVTYFNLDFNSFNTFTVNRILNEVTIEIAGNFGFSDFDGDGWVTALIDNGAGSNPTIDSVVYSEADSNPCDNIKITITANEVIDEYAIQSTSGTVVTTGNLDNPIIVNLPRDQQHKFKFIDPDGPAIFFPSQSQSIYVPRIYSSNIQITVTPGLTGGTVTAVVNQSLIWMPIPSLQFEYSLNDSDWQSSNSFTGQLNGDYTMYIRDQFGCKIQKDYTVTEVGTREPYSFLSRANFLSFSIVENIDGCTVHRNDENSLAHELLVNKVYYDNHLAQLCDDTTIHHHSNYNTVEALLRKEDGTETSLNVVKKSANLNRYQALDCKMYNYGSGYTGLYFLSGNTYDESLVQNGTFELAGNVPDFAIIGGIIEVVGVGTFYISDVTFDSNIGKKVILFENFYDDVDVDKIVRSTYDLLPFEVYEITIDWELYTEGCYDVVITETDAINGTLERVSENINLAESHDALHLRWFQDTNHNQDVFYYYGIQFTGRYRYTEIRGSIDDNVEPNIGDLTATLNESDLSDGNRIAFDAIPRNMALTLAIALSCPNLYINGLGYVKKESLRWEAVENTNLIEITVELIKTNINYNINRQGQIGAEEGYLDFNVPQLVGTDVGLIKS